MVKKFSKGRGYYNITILRVTQKKEFASIIFTLSFLLFKNSKPIPEGSIYCRKDI